jgi:ubiquinone/menaquinone biosynthesis C-methylase UbiE
MLKTVENTPREGGSSSSVPLTADQWGKHYHSAMLDSLLQRIRAGKWMWQSTEMVRLTSEGERVLEIGSGSGETSLILACRGRICTALDFARPCLDLLRAAAGALRCDMDIVYADARENLPFADNHFDMAFQAGLLEHFTREERVRLLKNWTRVSRRMVSIIPNAASLAYRVGKAMMEKENTWEYGLELPQYSLQQEFWEAGLKVTEEYTIGEDHALNFLPESHYLRKALQRWQNENICGDNCGQGYLLVTVGERL